MKQGFVKTSNVVAFLASIEQLNRRTAPEAAFVVAAGDAGFGKTRTLEHWAIHNKAVYVRLKNGVTIHWLLKDILRELGSDRPAPARVEPLFDLVAEILLKDPHTIVVDEVEYAMQGRQPVIDTVRDLSDSAHIEVVLGGREYITGRLRAQKQIWSRVTSLAEFKPLGTADVRAVFDQLCEVPVDDQVVAEVQRQSEGRVREIVKSIGVVEALGARARGEPVTLPMLGGRSLVPEMARSKSLPRTAMRGAA